jgi:hypothetical protein
MRLEILGAAVRGMGLVLADRNASINALVDVVREVRTLELGGSLTEGRVTEAGALEDVY